MKLPLFAAVTLLATGLFADGLAKYKDWGSSPQSYFMTKAERAQWAAINTEAEAGPFIDQFLARHGPGFAEEVAKRAQMADKYLTIGKMPGSKTLRGKIVILLGPPKAISVADHKVKGERSATVGGYMNAAADGGPSMQDMSDAARREGMSETALREYTFTYAGDKLPVPSAKDFSVTVDTDMATGGDRVADKKQAAALDQLFEAAAAAPLTLTLPRP